MMTADERQMLDMLWQDRERYGKRISVTSPLDLYEDTNTQHVTLNQSALGFPCEQWPTIDCKKLARIPTAICPVFKWLSIVAGVPVLNDTEVANSVRVQTGTTVEYLLPDGSQLCVTDDTGCCSTASTWWCVGGEVIEILWWQEQPSSGFGPYATEAEADAACEPITVACCGSPIPRTLTLTVSDSGGTVGLVYTEISAGSFAWVVGGTLPWTDGIDISGCGSNPAIWKPILSCQDGVWVLSSFVVEPYNCSATTAVILSFNCDPLSITFAVTFGTGGGGSGCPCDGLTRAVTITV